jgi:N-acetylglucosaminyl-diphospho-decaprenol L-rhamnosyltransferase
VRLTVIDNGQASGPALAAVLPEGSRLVSTGANLGYTGGANLALDHWRQHYPDAPLAVVGSHDLHVERDTLARLVAQAEAVPECGVLAPAVMAPTPVSGGVTWGGRWIQLPLDGAPELAEREWVNGTCLLLRRACVDAVGRFDERFGSYAEDVDYGLRARDLGWRVLVLTTAHAHSLGSASPRATDDKIVNTVLLAAKRQGVRALGTWTARLVFQTVVAAATTVIRVQDPARRAQASARAHQGGRALRRLATDGRLVAMLRSSETPPRR